MLRSKHITERLKDIENYLLEQYKNSRKDKKRDWRTYEERLSYKVKEAIRNFEPLIAEATNSISVYREKGNKPSLTLKQKVTLLLLKQLFRKSNRMMASMLTIFTLLAGVNVGYKTVERLYSDKEVELAIINLHTLILGKKGMKNVRGSGDGTGYSLTIQKHYASVTVARKDKAKKAKHTKKAFVYSFKLLDIDTFMYICYGMSLKSEKEAFDVAMKMLKTINVSLKDMRLDRYYSFPSYVDQFGDAKVYVIPRKNATVRGSYKWKETMTEFVKNTLAYLEQYYLRNNSESGFSVDKRLLGWKIDQRREDRIDTAMGCDMLWHNLFNIHTN